MLGDGVQVWLSTFDSFHWFTTGTSCCFLPFFFVQYIPVPIVVPYLNVRCPCVSYVFSLIWVISRLDSWFVSVNLCILWWGSCWEFDLLCWCTWSCRLLPGYPCVTDKRHPLVGAKEIASASACDFVFDSKLKEDILIAKQLSNPFPRILLDSRGKYASTSDFISLPTMSSTSHPANEVVITIRLRTKPEPCKTSRSTSS